eukprot:Gb_29709 [translate_table: standard]
MALRIHSLPAGLEPWKGQTQSLPINKDEYGFCRVSCKPNVIIARCNIGIDGALSGPMKELSRRPCKWKKTNIASPLRHAVEKVAGEEIEMEKAVLDLERIFKESEAMFSLLPMKPDWVRPELRGKPVRVAYQGVRGSYCQEAAVRTFSCCDAVPFRGMESAFEALESNAVDRAVVPVENSLDGIIDRNYDLMLRHSVHIVGEYLLPVNHCLLAVGGASKERLRRVMSHPQALSHCHHRLLHFMPNIQLEAVDNAADAARYIAENGIKDTAVIGSCIAGREYGLEVVQPNMQDDCTNTTRFLTLSRDPLRVNSRDGSCESTKPWKTTVAFSLEEGTPALFKALSIFALRDIKVTKIESRPHRENPVRIVDGQNMGSFKYFEYVFIVDLEAPMGEGLVAVQRALDQLNQIASFVRILGGYPLNGY